MSKTSHGQPPEEHGTMSSYIIGFVLSIACTLTAYFLVVGKSLTGNALLLTILSFAVWQMIIQIFFFLHLGRGPKPLYNVVFFIATVGIILVTVFGSIFIMDNLHYNMSPTEVTKKLAQDEGIAQIGGEETGACQELGANHKVTISGGQFSPFQIEAQRCDTLTFINEGEETSQISFGQHPEIVSYAGQEATVTDRRPKTLTLNQAGTFIFHDHSNPEVSGYITVNK